jgi:hypothetical protein
MTSNELFKKIKPIEQHEYVAQLTQNGLNFNTSDMYSRLIKDAARCNSYNSDIFYDLKHIEDSFNSFNGDEFEPIWIGFRKLGVDCTSFVLCRTSDKSFYGSLSSNYFALYSITVKYDAMRDWYVITLNEYGV